MELDFSSPWLIVASDALVARLATGVAFPPPSEAEGPGLFAGAELSALLGRMTGSFPLAGSGDEANNMIVLDCGAGRGRGSRPTTVRATFSWRASPERVEIYGKDASALLRGIYDFLDALGARWVAPGAGGERLPRGSSLNLSRSSGHSLAGSPSATLILGHGAYLEDWRDRVEWAARSGYASIFIHTTPEDPALGAAPASLYEELREEIAAEAMRRGLALELGGHFLSSYLPRSLFASAPELFREEGGKRKPDSNFCPSNPGALAIATEAFELFATGHPEISVFHVWPDDLPGGGWCSCPSCSTLRPAEQALRAAKALAAALARARPDAEISFLAYHDTGSLEAEALVDIPPNLRLLWAPRLRSWARGLGDPSSSLNASSLSSFRAAAAAWRRAGGGGVDVFEYWEDAVLFKCAVPPLATTMAGDVAAYRAGAASPEGGASEGGADSLGILCTGGRLPLAPRPNPWLLPRLIAGGSEATLGDWARVAYGEAAAPMLAYWKALEEAWRVDLDIEEGDCENAMPHGLSAAVTEPPADWGDPWKAGLERLAVRRERCEELFDFLRAAESALREAASAAASESHPAARNATQGTEHELGHDATRDAEKEAVKAEAREYLISGAILELDCARLAAYHESASGEGRAAADIALLALSAMGAASAALKALPDRRSRRELSFLLEWSYGLRLRAMRRAATRNPIGRALGRAIALARLAAMASPLRGAFARSAAQSPRPLRPRRRDARL